MLRQLHLALLGVHVIVLVIIEATAAALAVILQLQPKLVSHSVPGPSSAKQLLLISRFMIVRLVPLQWHPRQIYMPSKPIKCIVSVFDYHALLISRFMIVRLVPLQWHPRQIYMPSKPIKCIVSVFDYHALACCKLRRHLYEDSWIC